ncbi:MAG TPA: redoxin domain-containing protein [Candidatus Limnocylindrales bacterium]|jgi:thiol-disulfide isomerase/thioredoxin|nr:redoxin domain-containing protein [Candidatus Limnocylindrales bacterium]
MESRVPIVAGLASGALAALLLLVMIVAFGPDPGVIPAAPTPDRTAASGSPTGVVSTSAPPISTPVPSPGDRPFHIGEPAPSLVVPQVGGGTIDLTMVRGKPVWVNFMGTYCPPCRDEFPLMNGFYARYAEQGLIVIAIDVREEEGTIAAFAQELNATFPIGLDAEGEAARAWDAIVLPVHFWVDAEGIIRDGALGGIGPDIMAAGLRTIMPGVDVTP